jgi:hypothetical protein
MANYIEAMESNGLKVGSTPQLGGTSSVKTPPKTAQKRVTNRGRKSSSNPKESTQEGGLARKQGHEAIETEGMAGGEAYLALVEAEKTLIAQRGWQKGSELAELESTATIAGYTERNVILTMNRLKAIHEQLIGNVNDFDPVATVEKAGLTLTSKTKEMLMKDLDELKKAGSSESPKGKKKGKGKTVQPQTPVNPYAI